MINQVQQHYVTGLRHLAKSEWTQARRCFDAAANENPQFARAWLGKLCCDLKINAPHALPEDAMPDVKNNQNYQRAMQYADPELRNVLTQFSGEIQNRIDYKQAIEAEKSAATPEEYRDVAARFSRLGKYRDSPQKCAHANNEQSRLEQERIAELNRRTSELAQIIMQIQQTTTEMQRGTSLKGKIAIGVMLVIGTYLFLKYFLTILVAFLQQEFEGIEITLQGMLEPFKELVTDGEVAQEAVVLGGLAACIIFTLIGLIILLPCTAVVANKIKKKKACRQQLAVLQKRKAELEFAR